MKKILSIALLFVLAAGFLPTIANASDTGYFIVTAYYSPLPDQEYYITGNYESEIRLNGQGIAGASGKGVFSGMLAAPGKYAFGTKIELDGVGIGSVEDRGGAIVPAGERGYSHDRIDIWVGYGDEGLRRAMYWGKRKIAGRIISSSTPTALNYADIPAPSWAVPQTTTLYGNTVQVKQNSATINQTESVEKKLDIFSTSLGKGSDSEYIIELQNILREIGYYTPEDSTGEYDTQTIDSVYNLQINNEIVTKETDAGAGSYGPKTRQKLEEIYTLHLEEIEKEKEIIEFIESLTNESLASAEGTISAIESPLYGDISANVRELQKTLNNLGYFDFKDTAIFGVKTKNSILEFQLANQVIETSTDTGAGIFGPKTKEFMIKKLSEQYLLEVLELEGLTEKYNEIHNTEVIVEEIEVSQQQQILTA